MQLSAKQITEFKAEASRRDLKRFIKEFWCIVEPTVPFVDGYHVDAICDHLANIEEIENLLICMPPGFAKSLLVSVFFPCWWWATKPSDRFIYASHSLSLSERDSMKCRRIIGSDLYQSYYRHVFQISDDQDTKRRFDNNKTGFRLATSIDSGVTGERANFAVVDDPHNVREIESKAQVEAVTKWYSDAFSNRITPQRGFRINVMQRTGSNDLAGHIIKNDKAGNWCKLILPMEFGKCPYVSTRWQDPRTEEGELLCPALHSKKKVAGQKAESGKSFESQYNQSPGTSDVMLNPDCLKVYEKLPEGEKIRLGSVDLAISAKGDYTVIVTADVFNTGDIYLIDLTRDRIPGIKLVPKIKEIYEQYQPRIIYIEDVAFQRLVIEEARFQRLPVKGIRPDGSKEARADMLSKKLEAGQVYVPHGKAWVEELRLEMAEFPQSTFDDQIDALSQLAIQANRMFRRLIEEKAPEETPEEKSSREDAEKAKQFRDILEEGLR